MVRSEGITPGLATSLDENRRRINPGRIAVAPANGRVADHYVVDWNSPARASWRSTLRIFMLPSGLRAEKLRRV